MGILTALGTGIRRVASAPLLVLGVYLFSMVLAAPLALAVRDTLRESLGGSLVADSMRSGFDMVWHAEFAASQKDDLSQTFGPWISGGMPVIENFERLMDGEMPLLNWTIGLAAVLYLFAWAFFAGGIIDRYANPGAPHLRVRFFSHCAEYFPVFTQLLLLSVLYYWAVFRFIVNPLHRWVERATAGVTVEETVIHSTAGVYALAGMLLILGSLVLDYARISVVVQKRKGMFRALGGGIGFVVHHPIRTISLHLLLLVISGMVMSIYFWTAPGAKQSTPSALLFAFLCGQAYVIARLVMKLWFYASQTVLMQRVIPAAALPVPPAPEKSTAETWGE
jgi:hypothetical protein